MKKAMTVLGLGAAAVAFSVSSASAMEQPAHTTTGINLRQDPSATSNKVSELQAGSKVTIKETKNGWTKVQTEDGQDGWVSGYYVSTDKQAAEGQKNSENVTDKNKNVNDAVKSDKEAVETVNKAQSKDQQVKDNTSFRAENVKTSKKYDDKAQNSNVKNDNIDNEESTQAISSNGRIKSTSSLNVRIGPSTKNSVSSVIYKGEMFKVVERASNGWVKVILNDGTTGWASGKYIDLTNEVDNTNIQNFTKKSKKNVATENTVQNSQSTNYGRVNNAAGLNVRSGAGTKNSVISTLKNNDIVNIIGEQNGWYKVRLSNGQVGYVGSTLVAKATQSDVSRYNKVSSEEVVDYNTSNSIKESSKDNASYNSDYSSVSSNTAAEEKVVEKAESLLGTRYSWGGTTPSGFDCSGFTQYVYKNAVGINIPRVSRDQARAGSAVSLNSAKAGDLLYFDTMGSGTTSHVGIYLGDGKFIHAAGTATNPDKVKVSSLSENWVNCLGARRFI